MIPISLYWNTAFGVKPLPCGSGAAVAAQKTVRLNDWVYTFVESNSTYTVYTTTNPYGDEWTARELTLPFYAQRGIGYRQPMGALYMLAQTGELYRSDDGVNWTATGQTFYSLVGTWQSRVLGIVDDNGVYKHDCYPRPDGFTPYPAPAGFPITGSSQMVTFVSNYDLNTPQSIMVGGRLADNSLTGATWGYDGEAWAQLDGSITPSEGVVLFPYFTFTTNAYWVTTQYTSWIAIGGRDANGVNNNVYVSINNGNTWSKAPESLAMPAYIEPRAFASVLVIERAAEAAQRASGLWKWLPVRTVPKAVTRANEEYKVPYIYLFGGENAEGTVYNQIWRGAIGRLSYPPIP